MSATTSGLFAALDEASRLYKALPECPRPVLAVPQGQFLISDGGAA